MGKHQPDNSKPKNRKELRKLQRNEKKTRRNNYFSKSKHPEKQAMKEVKEQPKKLDYTPKQKKPNNSLTSKEILNREIMQRNEKLKKLKRQMEKKSDKVEIEAMDKLLEQESKKVKKNMKAFNADGLDFILDAVDPEKLKDIVAAERQFVEINSGFGEDLALMTGEDTTKSKKAKINYDESDELIDDEFGDLGEGSDEDILEDEEFSNDDMLEDEEFDDEILEDEEFSDDDDEIFEDEGLSDGEGRSDEEDQSTAKIVSRKRKIDELKESGKQKKQVTFDTPKKKKKLNETVESDEEESIDASCDDLEGENESFSESEEGVWEDIYGRLRGKDGELIEEEKETYVPPALRAKMEGGALEKQRSVKLLNLEKQLKGPMNKLGEGNMHKIATQIEELYTNNSRNDMNETLTSLIFKSLISDVLASEKSVLEHTLLITILHANIGTEIGAQFLQNCIKKFEELFEEGTISENKKLDNVVRIIAHLYNFKLFHVKLMYEILNKLSDRFTETDIECILLILQSIGFLMRKDDPIAMKDFIIKLQRKASNASEDMKNNSRVKFMLDILLAVKNNNMSKIKNYDNTHAEHLKKLMKGFIRKGCYVTALSISLEDLLNADENGKWWVVGSAWSGKTNTVEQEQKSSNVKGFSQKILDLARNQKMNTDLRRNIFCVIVSAEDYLDAFGNLLQLALNKHQERDIIHVIIHCCLHEKIFNPFYAHLAQKFCEYDRRFIMMMKYSVWDKLKTLTKSSTVKLSNLAKLLTHLFLRKCLPITTLKVVDFSDDLTIKFIRQILIGILMCDDEEICKGVFANIAQSEELKKFRDSLKIFIQLFLSKNLNESNLKQKLLIERSKIIERVLSFSSKKAMF